MTYAPRWRLGAGGWYPADYAVEVEGEPGLVAIDDDDYGWNSPGDLNTDLWIDVCDALRDLGLGPDDPDDPDYVYPPESVAAVPWQPWDRAPWHVKAAILARRVAELETTLEERS